MILLMVDNFIVLFDRKKAKEMCSSTEKCTAESGLVEGMVKCTQIRMAQIIWGCI